MAKTSYSTTSAEKKKIWEEKFFRDIVKDSFFTKFESDSGDSIVHVKRSLEKEKGDQIDFGIRYTPIHDGVGPGTAMEGNEDKVNTAMDSVTLTRRRYAVRDDGELTRQRVFFSIDVESEAQLKEWATEFVDKKKFEAISLSPSKAFYGGAATSTATLAVGDLITPAKVSYMKAYAQQTNNHGRVPIKPIVIGGKKYFVLLIHPDVAYDLKRNSEYMQNLRESLDRSPDNPIFTGALGVSHDGVIFHEHENVNIYTTGGPGGAVPYAHNIFMGQQALLWAWGKDMLTVTRKKFDYDEEHGFQIALTYGVSKANFTDPRTAVASDFGSVAFYTARTKITDA